MKLVICEKANAARRIANFLSKGLLETNKAGNAEFHEFTRDGDAYVVVGLRGHIIDIDFPKELQKWNTSELRALVTSDPEKKVTERSIAKLLGSLAGDDTDIIIATDFDREGELIGCEELVNGIDLCRRDDAPIIKRARFSALTKTAIEDAFGELEELDPKLARAAEARRVIDLLWGATLTRYLTLTSRRGGKEFLSAGRVQTPTLALIDTREQAIKAFVPEPFWTLQAQLNKEEEFTANHLTERFTDEKRVNEVYGKVKDAKEATITDVKKSTKNETPPVPMNTTEFLRAANRIGFQPSRAMSVAEDLYTRGIISYPRTDNTVYPPSIDLKGIVMELTKVKELSAHAAVVLDKPEIKPTRGKKETTDHPPIYPVEARNRKDLDADQWKIYELVARRFLATVSDPSQSERTNIKLDIEGEPFKTSGLKVLVPGWRLIYNYNPANERFLPPLAAGDVVTISKMMLEEKETSPPPRFSQGGIIQEMEKRGLGTKSTRHEILSKLYTRGYISGKNPQPTPIGSAVVESLHDHATDITESAMTKELEDEMGQIESGDLRMDEVIDRSRKMLGKVLENLEEHQDAIGKEVRKALFEQIKLGTCSCGGALYIKSTRGNKRFVGCINYPRCRQSYPLPPYGKIVTKGENCEQCGTPVITIYGKKGKPWEACLDASCTARKGAGNGKANGKEEENGKKDGEETPSES